MSGGLESYPQLLYIKGSGSVSVNEYLILLLAGSFRRLMLAVLFGGGGGGSSWSRGEPTQSCPGREPAVGLRGEQAPAPLLTIWTNSSGRQLCGGREKMVCVCVLGGGGGGGGVD